MVVVARKIVTIRQNIQANPEFNFNINTLNFAPDEVIIKAVNVSAAPLGGAVAFSIYSDLFNDTFLTLALSSSSVINAYPNTSWVPRGGNGTWRFACLDATPTLVVFGGLVHMYLQLEFIKHG